MLKITDLSVHYGVIQALKGVSLEVKEKEIVALIGANGARQRCFTRSADC